MHDIIIGIISLLAGVIVGNLFGNYIDEAIEEFFNPSVD